METASTSSQRAPQSVVVLLCLLFLVSGVPALLYQIVWQRALFSVFGVNIESVTVVVTAFMAGLGLGSLAGGRLSANGRVPLLILFAGIEVAIGLFGTVSLNAIDTVGQWNIESVWATGLASFAVVLFPTMLMGATLPILVAFLVERSGNVGRSVGVLYFVNTLGSAIACFAASIWLMGNLGMAGTVEFASIINLSVGAVAGAWGFYGLSNPRASGLTLRKPDPSTQPGGIATEGELPGSRDTLSAGHRRFVVALILSAFAGFIALSYEILWVRMFAFATAGMAQVFPLVLGHYLLGIALGSALSRQICNWPSMRDPSRQLGVLGAFVLISTMASYLLMPICARAMQVYTVWGTMPTITIATVLLGVTFPLICHFGIDPNARAGRRVSYIYVANIVGSTIGPLFIGFVVMDHVGIAEVARYLAFAGIFMATLVLGLTGVRDRRLPFAVATIAASLGLVVIYNAPLFDRFYERLQYKFRFQEEKPEPFSHVVETKSGVITVINSDYVYGGGIYDGKFNVSLIRDRNMIFRAYTLSALHPNPKHVLMIGLSSGSWAQVIANHPQVEKLTIVELVTGFVGLIEERPTIRSVLENPKVELIHDDGRRWMRNHSEEKFDTIVMNTTFHWRANSSNLLSREFMQRAQSHLNKGGVLYLNTTESDRVYKTGLDTFKHGIRVGNFLALSNSAFVPDLEHWRAMLEAYEIDGVPMLPAGSNEAGFTLAKTLRRAMGLEKGGSGVEMEHGSSLWERVKHLEVISDDNMGEEWKFENGNDYLY